eukprot:gene8048-46353_t
MAGGVRAARACPTRAGGPAPRPAGEEYRQSAAVLLAAVGHY